MKCLIVFAIFALISSVFAGDITINVDQSAVDATCHFSHGSTTTQNPPALVLADSGLLSLDTFYLEVLVSRLYYLAHVNMSDASGDACSDAFSLVLIPGDDCNVLLKAQMSWEAARHCGVYLDAATSTSAHNVFRGSVLVALTEKNLPVIRDRTDLTRDVHSVLAFQIQFPTTVSTDHTITTYFPVTLEAAIIRQFDVRPPAGVTSAHSSIRLFTSVQYPFLLSNPLWHMATPPNMNLLPITQTTAYLLSGENCLNDAHDLVCEQEWLIEFDAPLSPPKCTFSGDYFVNFTVSCQTSIGTHCPLPLDNSGVNEQTGAIQMTITTEDFCPKVFDGVTATATLASFQDAAHTIAKDDFLAGDTIYFLATSAADKATISVTQLQSLNIVYTYPGQSQSTTILYPATGSIVTIGAHDDYHCSFSVPLDSHFPVPTDGSVSFSFQAVLAITFLNTQEIVHVIQEFTPRVFADASTTTNPVDAIATVSIAGPTSPIVAAPTTSSGMATNTLIYIIAGSCVGVILFATIAVILRRRVAAKKTTSGIELAGATATVSGATSVV